MTSAPWGQMDEAAFGYRLMITFFLLSCQTQMRRKRIKTENKCRNLRLFTVGFLTAKRTQEHRV
jgi:hypothetical protein